MRISILIPALTIILRSSVVLAYHDTIRTAASYNPKYTRDYRAAYWAKKRMVITRPLGGQVNTGGGGRKAGGGGSGGEYKCCVESF